MIHCIGDSHASFFSGVDRIQPPWPELSDDRLRGFRTYRLGPVLAYNLCERETTTRGKEKLFEIVETRVSREDRILLAFGEIDCRAHLLRQVESQGRDVKDIVRECVERYRSVILQVREMGFGVLVWNAVPSTRYDKIEDQEFPVYGTCRERNLATRLFNETLQRLGPGDGFRFVSIFDHLVDQDGLTRMEYFMDPIHLSQAAMPLAAKEFERLLPGEKLAAPRYPVRRLFSRVPFIRRFT